MVDTNIVIYATRPERSSDPPELIEMLAASKALLRKLPEIRVCAVTMVEYLRGLKPAERAHATVQTILTRFHVESIDGAVADLAVKLLEMRNVNEKVCPRCLGSESGHTCPGCGQRASSQQRLNDAMIAATADTRTGVDVLYAFDSGVLAFAPYVSRCRIERPPNAFGPLFSQR